MLKISSVLIFLFLYVNKLNAQYKGWRNQHVKWNIGMNYGVGDLVDNDPLKKKFNKISGILSVDVSISENDVYDSSHLYLQLYSEVSFPVKNPTNERLVFSNYGAGINLKSFFNNNNFKNRLFIIVGGKLDYVVWELLNSEKISYYRNIQLDIIATSGIGYALNDRIEFIAQYNRSFGKVYASNNLNNLKNLNLFTFGIRVSLLENWWFR